MARDPLQLLEREVHVLQRQDGGGEEPPRRRRAEVGDPVVVGAGQRIRHVGVAHEEEALGEPGRIQQRLVHAHRVHVGESSLRIPRALVHRMTGVRVQLADGVPGHAGAPQRMARQVGVRRVAEDLAVDLEIRAGPALLPPEPVLAERAVLRRRDTSPTARAARPRGSRRRTPRSPSSSWQPPVRTRPYRRETAASGLSAARISSSVGHQSGRSISQTRSRMIARGAGTL